MKPLNRLSALMLVSIMPLAACGGGEEDPIAETCTAATLANTANHTFVVDSVLVPANAADAASAMFSLDVDGVDESQGNDNQLGNTLGTLATTFMLDVAGAVNTEVNEGNVILLVNVKSDDLSRSSCAGADLYLGANPSPAACVDETDEVCRGHLSGDATFEIAASSPENATLTGSIVGGSFDSPIATEERKVSLELSLLAGQPAIQLDLYGARATASVTAEGIAGGVLGGAIKEEDVQTNILPVVEGIVTNLLAADCMGEAPDCCTPGSTGATINQLFDTDMDCVVTLEEIQNNSIVRSALTPDVDLFDASGAFTPDGMNDSLSIGLGFTATTATFTP